MQPADLNLTTQVTGHGHFLCVALPPEAPDPAFVAALDRLGVGMDNMHTATGLPNAEALRRGRFQWLRAEPTQSRAGDLPHPALLAAPALVYLEAATLEPLVAYAEALRTLLIPVGGSVDTLRGVQRPRSYTSHAMTQYAYAPALTPKPGAQCPLGVVLPQQKTAAWWAMDWMHRESFFLPRYDAQERVVAQGHARAAEAGIPRITRRLVHASDGYGREGQYDFIGYFEFADAHAATFRAVMAALRDVAQNPEWTYVREGPEWWGRRVPSPQALWEHA